MCIKKPPEGGGLFVSCKYPVEDKTNKWEEEDNQKPENF